MITKETLIRIIKNGAVPITIVGSNPTITCIKEEDYDGIANNLLALIKDNERSPCINVPYGEE